MSKNLQLVYEFIIFGICIKMLRVVNYFSRVKCTLPQNQTYFVLRKIPYATDRIPPSEGTDQTTSDVAEGNIRDELYNGGPLHLRMDQSQARSESHTRSFSTDETEDDTNEDLEQEEILQGLYTGEPLRLRVDQIQREAEEIRMMDTQKENEKKEKISNEIQEQSPEEMSATARKWRERRSERYFPKLKKPPRASTLNELKVETVIRSYLSRGHLASLIDPLYIARKPMFRPEFPSRTVLKQHRVPVDRDTLYHLLAEDAVTLGEGYNRIRLNKLMTKLNTAYCSTIGVEFSYVHDMEARNWIKDRMETTELRYMHRDQKRYCLHKVLKIESFSEFIKDKVPKELRRYIPLGSETSLLGVDLLLERAMKKHNARVFVLGMRRLGRMSFMANVLNVGLENVFGLIQSEIGKSKDATCLGVRSVVPSFFVKDVRKTVNLISSCSIPENFYPICLGYVRGLQMREEDMYGEKIWPVIIHQAKGLNSQGIVYETLKLSQLPNYETYGTIHIVFNNQMEQTLRRETHMTTEYCTDTLRTVNIPIFHVNGDDLTAVHYVVRMAADFRARFHRDVAVDIVSYSRFMTKRTLIKYDHIKMQQAIAHTEPIVKKYSQELIKDGVIRQAEIDNWRKELVKEYAEAWDNAAKLKGKIDTTIFNSQMFFDKVKELEKTNVVDVHTGVNLDMLQKICKSLCSPPDKMVLNAKQLGYLKKRRYLVENNKLDWILCEALAYGSLLVEGKFVRISGMDVNRRLHIVQEDVADGERYNLLNNIEMETAKYFLCKSTTSQYATAAFEYGYSCSTRRTLVIWEAPEGDKTSKAQVIIDHYIAGGYLKYNYHSNIVFLIPHYHKCESSSKTCNGRPERFLQLVNDCESQIEMSTKKQLKDTNMVLANASTPANLFHILRRQMYLPYRRPLVIFTPNLLVSHVDCKAQFSELTNGTMFKPYIGDESIKNTNKVKKVVLCTGRVYHDLKNERDSRSLQESIAICRIEQICPLPYRMINEDLVRYFMVKQFTWVQEEPINQGWWTYIEPRLTNLPSLTSLECVARPAKADGGSRSLASCYDEHYSLLDRAMLLK